jgi:AraC family transcriptional regulator
VAPNLAKVARSAIAEAVLAPRPGLHQLPAAGDGFRAYDCVCALGARSAPSAGVYARTRAGVELGGAFLVRSSLGDALLVPNAILLGNAGGEYEFHHVDDRGDRSVVFEYDDAFLEEIGPGGFRRASIPSSPETTSAAALAFEALSEPDPEAILEAALAVAGVAMAADARRPTRAAAAVAVHASRVARAIRYVETHSADDCSLATLAREARLTRYHFLRVFAALTGQTPRQHVIGARLRRAATALRTTRKPVTAIAFDVGFGDVSHFIRSFTRAFARSPRAYRQLGSSSR